MTTSQWPAEARAQYNELRQQICWNSDGPRPTGTFTDEANVPEWFRDVTAGLLRPPEAPTLQVARIWDPVDWPTLLANNPRRPAVSIGADGYGPTDLTWQMVADAYHILDDAGKTPSLDIDIEINAASELALAPTVLYCDALNPDLDRDLIARVDDSLDGQTSYNSDDGGWMWA